MRPWKASGFPNRSPAIDNLLAWYDANSRDLPWRRTRDPYAIWVSEVMLQQTQVVTVLPYFDRWMSRFPTIRTLAAADDQEALSLWQGLGYYRRCRMLLAGARLLSERDLPRSTSEWLEVPGVGRYTASAIASIGFDEQVAVVDGNVERVFARLEACEESGQGLHRAAWVWAASQVPRDRPGDWNQAMMELGATVCRPIDPRCPECPLKSRCRAFASGRQSGLPIASTKPAIMRLEREAWIHACGERYGLEQVPAGEWWEGMWRFPSRPCDDRAQDLEPIGRVRHTVTNHRISMTVYLVRGPTNTPALTWFSAEELQQLPLPSPYRKALALVALNRPIRSQAI